MSKLDVELQLCRLPMGEGTLSLYNEPHAWGSLSSQSPRGITRVLQISEKVSQGLCEVPPSREAALDQFKPP